MCVAHRAGPVRRGLLAAAALLGALGASAAVAVDTVLVVAGSGTDLGTMRWVAETFCALRPGLEVRVLPSIGSGGGVRAVLAGAIDLALTTRPLTEEERAAGARDLLYARAPLAIAVHADAPYEAITTGDLAAILAGRQSRWPDGTVARPVLRPRNDSDTVTLVRSLPELAASIEAAYRRRGVPVAMTDQDAADLIETVPGAVGPISLPVILSEQRALKALALDNNRPTPGSIADGTYPLAKPLYFVTGPSPGREVLGLIDFVRSEDGAAILRATGHLVAAPGAAGP